MCEGGVKDQLFNRHRGEGLSQEKQDLEDHPLPPSHINTQTKIHKQARLCAFLYFPKLNPKLSSNLNPKLSNQHCYFVAKTTLSSFIVTSVEVKSHTTVIRSETDCLCVGMLMI